MAVSSDAASGRFFLFPIHPAERVKQCNLARLGNHPPFPAIIPLMKATLLALVAVFCLSFVALAADISGKWTVDASAAPAGGGRGFGGGGTYEFKVAGAVLTGSITRPGRGGGDPTVMQFTDGKVTGDTFTFTVTNNFQGNEFKTVYNGKSVGDKIELTFDFGGRGNPATITLIKAK